MASGAASQPLFTIPFSGQTASNLGEEDDLFGGSGWGPPPAPPGAAGGSLGTEPSFAFDDLSAGQETLQSQPTATAFADHQQAGMQQEFSSAAELNPANAFAQHRDVAQGWQNSPAEPLQQQLAGTQAHATVPDQAAALWPQQSAQAPSAWPQTQSHGSMFSPQTSSQSRMHPQPHAQSSLQSHLLLQPQLQFPLHSSQAQSHPQGHPQPGLFPQQPQLHSHRQPLFQPPSQSQFQSQSQAQSLTGYPLRPPQQPPPPSHGQQHQGAQFLTPGVSQGPPLMFPSHPPSAPFQPAFEPGLHPQSLPFQAAFRPPALPQSMVPPLPIQSVFQPQPQPALQLPGGPLIVSTQRVSSPYAVQSSQHAQQEVSEEDFWSSQDAVMPPPESTGQSYAVDAAQLDAGKLDPAFCKSSQWHDNAYCSCVGHNFGSEICLTSIFEIMIR